jgi:hypothetical protein
MGAQHTNIPWRTHPHAHAHVISVSSGRSVANCGGYTSNIKGEKAYEENEANADFVILACNAHYELLAALRDLLSIAEMEGVVGDNTTLPAARAAIAKAEGRS